MQPLRSGRALAIVVSAAALVAFATPASAYWSKQEKKCSGALSKGYAKYQASILKELSRCRDADISGKLDSPDRCVTLPDKSTSKIDKARDKFVALVAKSCQSVCNRTNDLSCVADVGCPPNGAVGERCTGKGGTNPFRVASLGFPGPYCDDVLGHAMLSENDLGTCAAGLVDILVRSVMDNTYAAMDEGTGLSKNAGKCLSSISKAVQKALPKMHKAVGKCRDTNSSTATPDLEPGRCMTDDEKTVAALAKEVGKLRSTIAKKCTAEDVQAFEGLCQDGGAAPTTLEDAQDCIADLATELAADARGPTRHTYGPIGMINVTHPESGYAYCGDGMIQSVRTDRNRIGEECDGDDTPCGGGNCLPPGDLFECTCDDVARELLVIDGERVDSDAGWTGDSHDATHNDNFGYITELTNCQCDEFTQATCTGGSSDNVCDARANMAPRCSDDVWGSTTCDARGDGDGYGEDSDCFVCDENSANAGAWCASGPNPSETLCQSQCFDDATGLAVDPQVLCGSQDDCDEGETCKGRCDNTVTCNKMSEGSPLPLLSAAIPVCITLEYISDVIGTKNIVTGAQSMAYETRSLVQLGLLFAAPCPTCGGICEGGDDAGETCFGRCDASGDPCLVDEDCTGMGDTACTESDAECTGGACSLDLRCHGGQRDGQLCRPSATTPLGVVSADCPVDPEANNSGLGVEQPFGVMTTDVVQHPAGGPCTATGWSNYDCPCPDDGGVPTQPNKCAGACNAGVNEGLGCATGAGDSGAYTKCVGGSEAGAICDADADCTGGTCSGNPKQCTAGNPSRIGLVCTTNSYCDSSPMSGDGVCVDACPGGRCVPLCYPEGRCNGGTRDGDQCATDVHCGGGTCELFDDEDGLCAGGPLKFRCTGDGYTTLPCAQADVNTQKGCEAGNDGVLGNGDDIPGSGYCESRPIDCYINNGYAEGGTTSNMEGSPSDVRVNSAFCTPKNGNIAIDAVSGFGGPSRTRREGAAFVNVPAIP